MKAVIIEDDPEIVEAIVLCFDLRLPEVKAVSINQGLLGIALIEKERPDFVILDIGLPDISGFEVCRRIRLFSEVPVIMLTARDNESDKIHGLDAGADDYITKPFNHGELLARVKAVLRRSGVGGMGKGMEPLILGNLWVDFATQRVRVDGRDISLTPTEYSLLSLLARSVGQSVLNRVLIDKVWGANYSDADDYLKVYIKRLRIKLGDDPFDPRLILSEGTTGYRLARPQTEIVIKDAFESALGWESARAMLPEKSVLN
ncbi:MAG: response regulator transcription factor [Dehalococcoidia bacterium]|nr:response regulator transcription factor [Dehalococcoidia bacterium]